MPKALQVMSALAPGHDGRIPAATGMRRTDQKHAGRKRRNSDCDERRLRDALRAGKIDVVVGPVLAGEEQEFAIKVFGSDEVVVVFAPRGHPLCRRKVTIEDVAQYKWVLPAESVAMRQWLNRVFEANGLLGPQVQIEANSILLLPRLIAETALLSSAFNPQSRSQPRRRAVEAANIQRQRCAPSRDRSSQR